MLKQNVPLNAPHFPKARIIPEDEKMVELWLQKNQPKLCQDAYSTQPEMRTRIKYSV